MKSIEKHRGHGVRGVSLNDTLSAFNKRYETLMAQFDDLTHQQSQAIMNGEDMDVVNQRLESIHNKLVMQEDRMLSAFIADNFDNCLGPYVFQIATSGYHLFSAKFCLKKVICLKMKYIQFPKRAFWDTPFRCEG